jgi:hypothetical protein
VKAIYLLLFGPILTATAAEKSTARDPVPASTARAEQTRPVTSPARPLLYRPPKVGLPKVTAACGARNLGDIHFELAVLAPDHAGYTTQASPILVWHRSGPNRWPLEATIVVPGQPEPILQLKLEGDGEWHRLDLAKYHVQLQPGVTYQWAVAAILDPAHRSDDLVAGGVIIRVDAPDELRKSPAPLTGKESILEFARRGYWYDAVARLAEQLDRSPEDPELRQWCSSLCEQGGLAPLIIGKF